MKPSLQDHCFAALMLNDPIEKCLAVNQLHEKINRQEFHFEHQSAEEISIPGRPEKPLLVLPKHVKKRGISKQEGRNHLMHAVAHIEFNAINLALDAAYRFCSQPKQYYIDWIRVAFEEAKHFQLVCDYLRDNDVHYGDLPAHDGLWDMCKRTNHDVLARMALVPRVLEARGLDVTPGLMKKLKNVNDHAAVAVLNVIYTDEIDHVRIGSDWFIYHCKQRQLEPEPTFIQCVEKYLHGELRGPFNLTARQAAGFTQKELENLQKNYTNKHSKQ